MNADWLRKMADAEDKCRSVSVGGLAVELGMHQPPASEPSGREESLNSLEARLAADIRAIDGNHDKGAAELAEQLIARGWHPAPAGEREEVERLRERIAVMDKRYADMTELSIDQSRFLFALAKGNPIPERGMDLHARRLALEASERAAALEASHAALLSELQAYREFDKEIDNITAEPMSDGQAAAIADNVVAVSKIGELEAEVATVLRSREDVVMQLAALQAKLDAVAGLVEKFNANRLTAVSYCRYHAAEAWRDAADELAAALAE
jgi:hypothetical protein